MKLHQLNFLHKQINEVKSSNLKKYLLKFPVCQQ